MGNVSAITTEIKAQAISDLKVPVNTALDSIIATPSTQNVAGQGAQLLASLIPLLPVLEGQSIVDIATAIKAAINAAPATAA